MADLLPLDTLRFWRFALHGLYGHFPKVGQLFNLGLFGRNHLLFHYDTVALKGVASVPVPDARPQTL